MREVLARNLPITQGDLIVIESGENNGNHLELNFIEFIPSRAASNRPRGISPSWRFWEFYSWIYYDDMNLHFFIIRFPICFFFLELISYLLFGRTPGNMAQGIYLVGQNGYLHPGHYLLRTITLCLFPLWGIFYFREDRLLTDIISGSRAVVRREKR